MSRTYRCRHLPVHVGRHSTYKVVDGNGGWDYHRRFDILDKYVDEVAGPNNYSLRYSLRDAVESQIVWPVLSFHRYMDFAHVQCRGSSALKYYRTMGNRWARRRIRQILHNEIIDEAWEGHFPHRRERFNKWDLT